MKTQEKTIKVYYGLKWVEFKPITKEKYHRLKENSRLCFVKNAITYYPCDSEDKEFYVFEPIYTSTHRCYMFANKFYKGLCIMIDGERLTVESVALV
jgi:hypothetical protein